MANTKSTKRALLASVLSLILCLSMLVGTTFAWFTDSVTSANNVIVAGNLDLTLEYWNGTEWADVEGSSEILDKNALWEPGYTEVVYFKLENAGSLALKYQMGVNILTETAGVNAAGEPFLLSDYIYFDVVEGVNGETNAFADRDAAMAETTEINLISDGYAKAGELVADAEPVYLAMIVYMPTTVDNVANHDGDNVPEIQLGVNAIATQFTAEEDSFDKMYDEDAVFFSAVVSSEAELVEALANAKNNDIIGISGNVTWATGAGHGTTPFVTNATYITLKGVDENATFTAIGSGVGPVGIDNGTVVFDGLTVVDESVSYAENSWEFGYLEFRGNTVFNNCDFVNAIMMDGDNATFVNCSFNSNKDSEYAVWVSNGRATFEGCNFTGARGLKTHEDYGSEVEMVTVNNCVFANLTKKPGMAIGTVNADTAITLTNNYFVATQAGDQSLYSYETDTDVTTFTFVYENNTVSENTVSDNTELKAAIQSNAVVYLNEGEYSMPSLSGKEGVTIIGAEGAVIGGNTSTGFGGNFGKNTVIKNVTFKGTTNGVRNAYAQGGETVFENCTFEGDSTYGFHVDGAGNATFIFNNCTFSGFNAFAATFEKVVFNNCTFLSNGNYGHTNIWSVGEFNNCFFGPGASAGTRSDGVIYVNGEKTDFIEG